MSVQVRLEEKGKIIRKMAEGLAFWNATASGPSVWGMQPLLGAAPTVSGRGDKRSEVTRQWWKGKWGRRGRGSRSGDGCSGDDRPIMSIAKVEVWTVEKNAIVW